MKRFRQYYVERVSPQRRLSKAALEKKLLHKVQDYDKYGDPDHPEAKAARDQIRRMSGTTRKIRRPALDEASHDCKKCSCSKCGGSCKVDGKPCPKCHA